MGDTLAGFLPLSRRFFEHHFWTKKRVYSTAEAWLDLLAMACYEPEATMIVNNRTVRWKQGEVFASIRFLEKRWTWSKDRVFRFLLTLEDEEMITRTETNAGSIITICNYGKYNKNEYSASTADFAEKPRRSRERRSVGLKNKDTGKDTNKDSDKDTDKDTDKDSETPVLTRVSEDSKDSDRDTGKDSNKDTDKDKIKNIINKEYTKTASAAADAFPPEFEEKFRKLKNWIASYTPRVDQMKEPLTIQQAFKLHGTIENQMLQEILEAMHNYEPLIRKNRSTYLTIKNWQRRRQQTPMATRPSNSTMPNQDDHARRIRQEEEETIRLASSRPQPVTAVR